MLKVLRRERNKSTTVADGRQVRVERSVSGEVRLSWSVGVCRHRLFMGPPQQDNYTEDWSRAIASWPGPKIGECATSHHILNKTLVRFGDLPDRLPR